jgi:alpha-galactosidase
MRDALYSAGRPVVFSICEWGTTKPWDWAGKIGHLWRTTGDIRDNWDIPDAKDGKCWGGGVIINLDMQQGLEKYAGPGHWNDPDMLEVGNKGLTENENKAHFTLWCMLAAPLFSGNDIRNMDDKTREILTNKEIIDVDQDPLGIQGYKIRDYGQIEVFYKILKEGDIAICVFNRFPKKVDIELDWLTLNLTARMENRRLQLDPDINDVLKLQKTYQVRDLWKKTNIGNTNTPVKAEIEAHDVLMIRLILTK